MKDEVYRVVAVGNEDGIRFGGYRNATKLYNSLTGARGQARREKRDAECRRDNLRAYAERRGEPVTVSPVPEFKIQKSVLVWEDVE